LEQSIQKILSTIDDAIAKFQNAIPSIQKLVYDELQPLVKQLQVKNGKLLNNVDNLKLIGSLKNKLERVIASADYKNAVQKFVDSFSEVSNLNNEYFAQFNKKYKPKNTLPIIKELAVNSTINDLIGQGLKSNIIAPIEKILQQNIAAGGSYTAFQDVLRNHILTNETNEGNLQRYTKQITNDAIHQYNAQYAETIAQDLQFNWGRYIGSNITTSREFCMYLRKKQWVHKSELPAIIEGNIDGHECKLSKTTGLPLGMIPDTNADNFKVRRGGYNCGDQFFWVPDSAVPKNVRDRFENKGKVKNNFVDTPEFNRETVHNVNNGQTHKATPEVMRLLADWGDSSNTIRSLPNSDIGKQWLDMAMEEGITKHNEIYRGLSYSKNISAKVAKYNFHKENYTKGKFIQFNEKMLENGKDYDNRFLSATHKKFIAEDKFGNLKNNNFHTIIMTIKSSNKIKGLDVNGLTGFHGAMDEYEVIFGDTFVYEVISNTEVNGNLFIELHQHSQ
jgi:hypothetical protein